MRKPAEMSRKSSRASAEFSTLSEPWPRGGQRWSPEAEWEEVGDDDCCVWPFKTWLPAVALEARTTGGGTGLDIRVKASHNCGISYYQLTIRITNIKTGESWVIRPQKTIKPPKDVDDNITYGQAGAHKLPVGSLDGWHIRITGSATSECGTSKDFPTIERDIVFK